MMKFSLELLVILAINAIAAVNKNDNYLEVFPVWITFYLLFALHF